MNKRLFFLFFGWFFFLEASAQNPAYWIEEGKAVVALSNLTMYSDSSFNGKTVRFCREGDFLALLGSTVQLYEDDAQKQLFRWYKVRTLDHQTGWVFGDGVAVMLKPHEVSQALGPFYKSRADDAGSFGPAKFWIGAVQGRDIISTSKYIKPTYREAYLVLSRDSDGKSIFLSVNGKSLEGSVQTKSIFYKDITGDQVPEIILEQCIQPTGSKAEQRFLEAYTLVSEHFEKVFEEKICLFLDLETEKPSPALYKCVDFSDRVIRIEYIDFSVCKSLEPQGNPLAAGYEVFCTAYVTYTYLWNPDLGEFEILYEPSRVTPLGKLSGSREESIRRNPANNSEITGTIGKDDALEVLFWVVQPQSGQAGWFQVRTNHGNIGYISAAKIEMLNTEHGPPLYRYFNTANLDRSNNLIRFSGN